MSDAARPSPDDYSNGELLVKVHEIIGDFLPKEEAAFVEELLHRLDPILKASLDKFKFTNTLNTNARDA